MSFTNQKSWVATEDDCNMQWGTTGKKFKCGLCGHIFKVGDIVRWCFTNDVPGADGNPLLCEKCDGPKNDIVEKIKQMRKEVKEFKKTHWKFI